MKLNIGAGNTRYDDYVNCDYDDRCNPEYVFDLEKDRWPFEDNSVEAVKAYHVLEHLGDGYFHALKELYRVCKDGAEVHVKVPHHRNDTLLHDATHKRAITPYGILMFSKKFNDQCKEEGSPTSQLAYYIDVDFETVEVKMHLDRGNPKVAFYESLSEEVLRHHAYSKNNVFIETEMLLKVVKNPVE